MWSIDDADEVDLAATVAAMRERGDDKDDEEIEAELLAMAPGDSMWVGTTPSYIIQRIC